MCFFSVVSQEPVILIMLTRVTATSQGEEQKDQWQLHGRGRKSGCTIVQVRYLSLYIERKKKRLLHPQCDTQVCYSTGR